MNRIGALTKKGWAILVLFGLAIVVGAGLVLDRTNIGVKATEAVKQSSGSTDPIHVCVVTWGGYAGGQYFNGGFKASKDSRYWDDYKILVDFPVIDDFNASRLAYKSGECNLMWQTADALSTEVGNLINAGFHPVVAFQSDWSRGGDAVVVVRGINSFNELRGKRVAVAFGTPSHTFLLRMLQAANMSLKDITVVEVASAIDAATAFKAGRVDAAVVWSPDDQDCVQNVPGSKVLTSTREATHIIADIFYAERDWVQSHQRELASLIEGWMRGAAEINNDPKAKEKAVAILAAGLNQAEDLMRNAINNARLTTYGDNVNFFNLKGNATGVTGEMLYLETGKLFEQNTNLVSHMPSWREITDLTALRSITSLTGREHAAESGERYEVATQTERVAPALSVKPAPVHFETGSAVLSETDKSLIDLAFVPIARSYSNRIRIEGNTDSTGSREVNRRLSEARARSVRDYLVQMYQIDPNRFVVVGNGPDKPVASNDTPDGRAKNRRTEFQLIGAPSK